MTIFFWICITCVKVAGAQGIASGVLTITINRACPLLLLWPESSIKSDQSKHLCQEIPSEQAHQAWQNNDTMVYSSQGAGKFMCYYLYPQFLVDHFTFHIQNTHFFKISNIIRFTETVPLLLVLLRKNLGSQLFLMWKTWSRCPGSQQHINLFFFLNPKIIKKIVARTNFPWWPTLLNSTTSSTNKIRILGSHPRFGQILNTHSSHGSTASCAII